MLCSSTLLDLALEQQLVKTIHYKTQALTVGKSIYSFGGTREHPTRVTRFPLLQPLSPGPGPLQ